MGSFDKNKPNPAAKQKQQIAMMVALGVVLAGVMFYQFGRGTPRSAEAASFTQEPAAAETPSATWTESTTEALAKLNQDPTANLLRGSGGAVDPTLEVPPENPFAMSGKWRSTLVKLETTQPTNVLTVKEPVVQTVTKPQTVSADDIKLQGVFRDNRGIHAIISGKIVSVGSVLGNARIVDIQDDRIVLQHASSNDGPRVEVLIKKAPR